MSELASAIEKNKISKVESLIRQGKDVNARGADGDTPLILASIQGRTMIVKKLIDAGADVDGADNNGNTPLHRLVMRRLTTVVHPWDLNNRGQIFVDNLMENIGLLLQTNADVNALNNKGYTPLDCVNNVTSSPIESQREMAVLLESAKAVHGKLWMDEFNDWEEKKELVERLLGHRL